MIIYSGNCQFAQQQNSINAKNGFSSPEVETEKNNN